MKQVAGNLRLNLAQYREMAAFAQFGSDLDKATRDMLKRGERMVAVLKQGQYAPQAVERQIVIVYAGTSGALDDLPVDRIADFEKGFFDFIDQKHPGILETIHSKKTLDDGLKADMDKAFKEFQARFT
jgi:F-type H+-transporting ATPase subunit alpha